MVCRNAPHYGAKERHKRSPNRSHVRRKQENRLVSLSSHSRIATGNDGGLAPIGGPNSVVESDETVFGGKAKNRAYAKKEPKKHTVLTLVERDGQSRSFHIANVKAKTLRETISRKSYLITDELASYESIGKEFSGHGTVNYSVDEYVRVGNFMHINTAVPFQPNEALRV